MTQRMMFDLDAIPIVEPPKPTRRWYISVMHQGKEYVLTATHSDVPSEWSEVGTFRHQPHLYSTYAGARRMAVSYVKPGIYVVVKEWKGWQ